MVDAIVSFAVETLGDFLIQEVVSLHGVKHEVGSLQRELKWMRSFLEDAEQKQDGDPRIREWISEIQDIAYDTEDVIEKIIFKAKGQTQTPRQEIFSNSVKNCFGISTIANLYGIGKEIKALKNRVLEVSRKRVTYGINNIGVGVQEGASSSAGNLRDLRITTPYADEDVVGFEDEAQSLQEKLLSKGVISILGMGGLGKTTLARKLYNSNCTKFDLHAWVCVSEEWNTRDLFERLIKSFKKQLTKDELERLEKMKDYDMREYLRNLLQGHKYLVVIDDMWQKEAWQSLRRALPDNQNGSRIIITTRKESVAEVSDETHKLRFLREDESWQLFCKKAFPESGACPPNMEILGKEMVEKSSGLPLAIIVLGGLLSRKQFHEWHVVKEHIWRELKNYSSDIPLLLALSYNDLSHELKSCFLYLALFPEDSIIDVEKLTRMWVAEQFIAQRGGELDDLEEVAENYLMELIDRSLIQVVKRNWRMVTRCRVHDLLRDLAVNKAKELNFLHIYDEVLNSAPSYVACRRIGFQSGFESFMSFAHFHQRVRTISYMYNGFLPDKQMVMNLVSKFGLLRVLDLNGVRVTGKATRTFSKAVGKLVHLRYLGLNNTGIDKLPESIGNCLALQTLYIDGVFELSTDIKKLKQLRHLSGWFHGTPLLFEELTNLQSLMTVNISDWLKQQKGNNEFSLNVFGKLQNLKVLSLLFIGGDDLQLVSVQPLLNCRHLIELKIKGGIKKLPESIGNLQALQTLDVSSSNCQIALPRGICKLKQLRHLIGDVFLRTEEGSSPATSLVFVEELTNLRTLKHVYIDSFHLINAFGKLQNLKVLSVEFPNSYRFSVEALLNCRQLIQLKIGGRIENLPKEMHKSLSKLKHLELHYSALEEDPMPALEMLPNLMILLLDCVEVNNMTCTAAGFPQLEVLNLFGFWEVKMLRVEEGAMPRLRALSLDYSVKQVLPERLRSLPDDAGPCLIKNWKKKI